MLKNIFKVLLFFLFFQSFIVFSDTEEENSFFVKLVFQNPSFIINQDDEDVFYCKKDIDECKINYDLLIDNGEGFKKPGNKYECLWDFGFGETGEENKCNPNTIFYPKGENITTYKVYEKNNINNYIEKEIKIINNENIDNDEPKEDEDLDDNNEPKEDEDLDDNKPKEDNEEEIDTTKNIKNLKILFQSPSYLDNVDGEDINYFTCLENKKDCKVNYNLKLDIGNGFIFPGNKYECLWNFGFGETKEENKCNPDTIIYPIGEFITSVEITEKGNLENSFKKEITIKNNGYKDFSNNDGNNTKTESIYIQEPEIIVLGGLDERNNCIKNDCKIKFKYLPKNKKEKCFWEFDNGEFTKGNENKCISGIVKYHYGDFRVYLKVYEDGNNSNFKESYIDFSNTIKDEIKNNTSINNKKNTPHKQNNKTGNNTSKDISKDIKAVINITKNNFQNFIIKNNNIICYDFCNLKFDGKESIGEKLKYNWNFGNGLISNRKITPIIYFPKGKYEIKLQVEDNFGNNDTTSVFLEVKNEAKINKKNKKDIKNEENYSKNLFINSILLKSEIDDKLGYIEIKNSTNKDINLDNCELKLQKKSYDISYSPDLKAKKSIRLYHFLTNFLINDILKNELKIICDEEILDTFVLKRNTPKGFLYKREFELDKTFKIAKDNNGFNITYNNSDKNFQKKDDEIKSLFDYFGKNDEDFLDFLEKNFQKKIQNKKGEIKILGKTIPNVQIFIHLKNETDKSQKGFFVHSLKNGNFNTLLKNIHPGNYEIDFSLAVNKNILYNYDTTDYLEIEEQKETKKIGINKSKNKKNNTFNNEYIHPKSIITVQGRKSKDKSYKENKIICSDYKKCNINFDGRKSLGNNLNYKWNLGDGTILDIPNPNSHKFSSGNYKVSLEVSDEKNKDISYFTVKVLDSEEDNDIVGENDTTKLFASFFNKNDFLSNIKKNISSQSDINEYNMPNYYKNNKEFVMYLILSTLILVIFILGGYILLKNKKII